MININNLFLFARNPLVMMVMIVAFLICIMDLAEFIPSAIRKRYPQTLTDQLILPNSFFIRRLLFVLIDLLLVAMTLCFNNNIMVALGSDDLRAQTDGTYCYYVIATNEKGKTNTLPAKITKLDGLYFVEDIYSKNGGYLHFSDGDYIYYDEIFNAFDQHNNEWEVKLTTKKTHHPKVDETVYTLKFSDIYLTGIIALVFLLTGIFNIADIIRHFTFPRQIQ